MNRKIIFFTIILCSIAVIFSLCKKIVKPEDVYIDYSNSYFSNFYIEGDTVKFLCSISIVNSGKTEKTIELSASSQKDCEGGLLKSPTLVAEVENHESAIIIIPPKSKKEIDVIFSGQHGESNIKEDRLLPEITMVELR